jgi:chain length determinant protein EpsF
MNIRQFLLILRLRWILIVLCTVAATAAAVFFTMRQPKVYTSQTSLLLDVKADPLVATFMPSIASPAFFATQSHIIKSDRVAAAVVRRLGLEKSPEAVARWRAETGGKVPLASYFSNMMQRGLAVEPAPGTNVLNLSFTAADPKFAAVVANAYAQAYIDFSVDLRVEPARNYAAWFDGQLKNLRAELEAAQTKLSQAQQSKGIISTDGKLDEEVSKLSALMGQLAATQVEMADSSVRARNSGLETSPDISQNGQVQTFRAQLAKLEADFADAKSRYGEQHPQYLALQGQIAVAKDQLAAEIRKAATTSSARTQVSSQKVAELNQLIEIQKKKVLGLRGGRDDLEVLIREVETAQRAYEAVANRRAQLTLESQSEQAAARILSVAVEAISPSSKAPLHVLLGVLGGFGLGAALAAALEILDRRVRSTADISQIEGLPLLAVIGGTDRPTASIAMSKAARLGFGAAKLLELKRS